MPYFYIRGGSFIAMFRIENGEICAEIVPSANLLKDKRFSKCFSSNQASEHPSSDQEDLRR